MKKIDGIVYANQTEALLHAEKHMRELDQHLRDRGITGTEASLFKMLIHLELIEFVMTLFEVKENADE